VAVSSTGGQLEREAEGRAGAPPTKNEGRRGEEGSRRSISLLPLLFRFPFALRGGLGLKGKAGWKKGCGHH
jgi:hypothetical protein